MLGFDGKVQLCAHNFGSISEIVSKPMNSSTEQITNVSSQETKQTVRKIERNKCKTQNKRTNNLQYEKVLVFTTRIIKFDSRRKKKPTLPESVCEATAENHVHSLCMHPLQPAYPHILS